MTNDELTPEQQDQQNQYIAHIFAFFSFMEGLRLVGHSLHKGFSDIVVREQKQHLTKLLNWVSTWNAQVSPKNRMAYAKEVQDMFTDIGAMVMEVMMTTAAVPPEQMDYFMEGVKKLQIMCENRENTRLQKQQNENK